MNDKKYKKRLDFQNNMISRQSEQIEELESEIRKLKLELEEKNRVINSVDSLRLELMNDIKNIKEYKEQYKNLIEELRTMKTVFNQTVFKGRWRLVKFLIK